MSALPAPRDRAGDWQANVECDQRDHGIGEPGNLWPDQHGQLGIEATIPMNHRGARGVGRIAQLHFFIDDLFPQTIGRPILRN